MTLHRLPEPIGIQIDSGPLQFGSQPPGLYLTASDCAKFRDLAREARRRTPGGEARVTEILEVIEVVFTGVALRQRLSEEFG